MMLTGHPIFWILAASVLAPLLAEIPIGSKVPVVVFEVGLGIVLGPQVLNLVQFGGFIETMFTIGMAMTLFMGGMELDFREIKGPPLFLAVGGWTVSLLIGLTVLGLVHLFPEVHSPMIYTLALCTTGIGVLTPMFRDRSQLGTAFGRLVLAAGTLGEVGPVVAISVLMSQRYSSWQESGLLVAFLMIVGIAVAVGMGSRPPVVMEILSRHMNKSTQLPVRIALLLLAALLWLAGKFGFDSILGAFAAGMLLRQVTRGEQGRGLREKIDTLAFAWFYPFFFVGTGIKCDMAVLGRDSMTLLLVPAFSLLFLLIRGVPVFIYGRHLLPAQRLPFVFSSAVPSLAIIVVITEIGLRSNTMRPDAAAALIGAALLSSLVFPTVVGALLPKAESDATGHAD